MLPRLLDHGIGGSSISDTLETIGRLLQSSTEYSIVAGDLNGRIALWNEGARRLYGYEPEEMLGQFKWDSLFTRDDLAAGKPLELRAIALREGRWQGQVIQIGKGERRFTAELVVTPWRGRDDTLIGFLSITKEIQTAHVEGKIWGLIESAPDAMLMVDEQGRIALVNARTEEMFGYSREELLNQPVEILVPKRFRENHPAHRNNYFRQPHVRLMGEGRELYGLRKDGSEFSVEISLSPLEIEERILVACSIRDITDRKRVEEAIRGQAQMLDLASDTIMIRGLNDVITYWNQGAERLYGWTREEAIGQVVHTFLATIFPSPLEDIQATAVREGQWEGELIHRRRDGQPIIVYSRWTLQRDSNGDPIAFLEINNDITARKAAEQILREKNIELEKANRAKDRFLATMSHELRTPLNAIIGFTGTLLMKLPGPLTNDQEKQLRTVQSSARHLLSLINDLLDLAKIESGKVELNYEPIVCQAVLQGVVTALRPLAEAKGLRFEMHLPSRECIVRSDRRILSQILLNLANNAIKFTDTGGVSIELISGESEGRKQTEFHVTDTGIGIRAEDQAKLFQAFTQIDQTGKKRREGTGLGLHLSQKMAEVLGGRIVLRSELGRGSTFSLILVEG